MPPRNCDELDRVTVEANEGGAVAVPDRDPGQERCSIAFWMKAWDGWRKKKEPEITGKEAVSTLAQGITVSFVSPGDTPADNRAPPPILPGRS